MWIYVARFCWKTVVTNNHWFENKAIAGSKNVPPKMEKCDINLMTCVSSQP